MSVVRRTRFYDPNYSRSLESNDVPQRLVLSFLYELPFGPTKAILVSRAIRQIIGTGSSAA